MSYFKILNFKVKTENIKKNKNHMFVYQKIGGRDLQYMVLFILGGQNRALSYIFLYFINVNTSVYHRTAFIDSCRSDSMLHL